MDAFSKFVILNPNSKLLLVGMLEERDSLPKSTKDIISNNKNIIITGYIPNQEIHNYYALMDGFVLPHPF